MSPLSPCLLACQPPESGGVLWPPQYGASTQQPIRATFLARESHGAPHTEHGKTSAPSGGVPPPMAAHHGAMSGKVGKV